MIIGFMPFAFLIIALWCIFFNKKIMYILVMWSIVFTLINAVYYASRDWSLLSSYNW